MQSAEELLLPGYHLMDTDWTHLKSESVDQALHTLYVTGTKACQSKLSETQAWVRRAKVASGQWLLSHIHGSNSSVDTCLQDHRQRQSTECLTTRMCRATEFFLGELGPVSQEPPLCRMCCLQALWHWEP